MKVKHLFFLFLSGVIAGISLRSQGANNKNETEIICGAKVIRSKLGISALPPYVEIEDKTSGWEVKEGEAWTGFNPHEFYFTLKNKNEDAAPPVVRVIWKDAAIKRVIGAKDQFRKTEDGVTFQMNPRKAGTSVSTPLRYGSVHMAIFHNWEVRRAGYYRKGEWPETIIQSQLNYLFAAREMCRAMGYTDTVDPGFNGDIRLYGFETNFPNGHVDHPPHFHIMLGWPGWTGTQAGHFLLDEKGRILKNNLSADMGTRMECSSYNEGEVCAMHDPDGKLGFELIVADEGKGAIMRRAAGQTEYRISASKTKAGAIGSVDVSRREPNQKLWTAICNVHAEDDASQGLMCIIVTYPDGKQDIEKIAYDVDTGVRKKLPAMSK